MENAGQEDVKERVLNQVRKDLGSQLYLYNLQRFKNCMSLIFNLENYFVTRTVRTKSVLLSTVLSIAEHECGLLWFMHDGALRHFSQTARTFVNKM